MPVGGPEREPTHYPARRQRAASTEGTETASTATRRGKEGLSHTRSRDNCPAVSQGLGTGTPARTTLGADPQT